MAILRLLDNLSPSNKLDLISRLTMSIKTDITDKKKSFKKSFGAFAIFKKRQKRSIKKSVKGRTSQIEKSKPFEKVSD